MRRRAALIWKALAVVALGAVALAPATPAFAAGFAINEQSSKAMGMANAFVAQADDPSAIFFNAGGLAFLDKVAGQVGATYITDTRANFRGANPFPGEGVTASEKRLQVFPPHAYAVWPINPTWKVGLGIETPFGLQTRWNNPDTFAGRYLSTLAAIRDVDINPTIAWQVTPELGIGVGGIARISEVTLERDIPAVDPFTFHVVNVAKAKLKSNNEVGYGFDVGILHKPASWFSWGANYRSKIDVTYKNGSAVLFPRTSGDPIFDAIVAHQLPFNTNIPVNTKINHPATAALGIAVKPMPALTVEVDGNWFGWSTFKTVPLDFPTGQLPSSVRIENWKDTYVVRAGLNWTANATWQWRLGYVYDQTPQPEVNVDPLLPDANRNGFTAGVGYNGGSFTADLGVLYLLFKDRTRTHTLPGDGLGPFNGTYKTNALLVGLTLGFHQ
jgi:long-chain fatty acid transport protein